MEVIILAYNLIKKKNLIVENRTLYSQQITLQMNGVIPLGLSRGSIISVLVKSQELQNQGDQIKVIMACKFIFL
jgi:hypothetical protein